VSRIDVGGQAVIEGVMMRSPSCFVVACRTGDGHIVIRDERWRSVWEKVKFLRWPFLRGGVVLWETLQNGLSALTFSANLRMEELERQEGAVGSPDESSPSKGAIGAEESPPLRDVTPLAPRPGERPRASAELGAVGVARLVISAVVLVLVIFVVLPHLLTSLCGFRPETVRFHLVDGLIKLAILVAYVGGIALLPDIRRVYQYHGAEHKAIATYEANEELTVGHARAHSRFHPRCGTSFLLIVILTSVLLFALALHRPLATSTPLDHLLKVVIKIPLMLPVAGIAYELIKLAGRRRDNPVVRFLIAPGLWLQRLTTREPTDDQIEVALTAVGRTVAMEEAAHQREAAPPLEAASAHR
jgi:uncharacterized protein YqhQ